MPELGNAVFRLETNSAQYNAGWSAAEARADAGVQSISQKMSAMGKKIGAVGASMTRKITTPLLAIGGASVKFAMDFEESMTHINALVGASEKDMKMYESTILQMAKSGMGSATGLADALYFITSSGFEGAGALKVLQASAKASEAGLGDVKTVADLTTSAVSVYGKKNLSAARAVDILTAAVREGKGEPAEFAASMGRVLPIAAKMNVSFGEAAGATAALTLGGLDAAEATTALRAGLLAAFKPTKEAKDALDSVGLSSAKLRDIIAKKGVLAAFQELNERFDGNSEKIGAVLGNVRGLVGALNLSGSRAKANAKLIDEVTNSAGAADEAFKKASESGAKKFHDGMHKLQATMIQLGAILIPPIAQLVGKIAALADRFGNLSPHMQKVILIAAGVLAALGPLVSLIGTLVIAIGFLASPIGLVVLGIAALTVGLVLLYKRSETFRDIVGKAFELVKAKGQAMWQALKPTWTAMKDLWVALSGFIRKHGDDIRAILLAIGDTVLKLLGPAFRQLESTIKGVLQVITNVIKLFAAVLRGDWGAAWNALKGIASGALNIVKAQVDAFKERILLVFSALKTGAIAAFRGLWGLIEGAAGSAYAFARNIGIRLVRGIINGLGGLVDMVKNKIESGLRSAVDKINPFSPVEQGGFIIGTKLARGTVEGWVYGTAELPDKMSKTLRAAIERAQVTVGALRGKLQSAMGTVASDMMRAFDANTQQGLAKIEKTLRKKFDLTEAAQTPTEALIAKMEGERQDAALQQAVTDAQAALFAAMNPSEAEAAAAGGAGSAEGILAAQRQLEEAKYQLQLAALSKQAAAERTAEVARVARAQVNFEAELARQQLEFQAQRDLEARHLQEQLVALEARMGQRGMTVDKANKELVKLMKSHGVSFRDAGADLGRDFARGLEEQKDRVENAARALANVVARYLKTRSPAEEGPLADLDQWWKPLVPTLTAQVDLGLARQAGQSIAGALAGVVQQGTIATATAAPALADGQGGGNVIIEGDLVVRDEIDAELVASRLSRKVTNARAVSR